MADDDPPTYATREARKPDGTRVMAVYKPGSAIEHMSDEEFIAEFRKVKDRVDGARPHLRLVRDDEAP